MNIEQNVPPIKIKDKNGGDLELEKVGTEENPKIAVPVKLVGTDATVTIEVDADALNTALTDGSQKAQIVDGEGNSVGNQVLYQSEEFTSATNNIITFTEEVNGIVISNDGYQDITVTIGTDAFIVKAGEIQSITRKTAFESITLNEGAANFRVRGLQR